jgi:hypothetical protein
MKSAGVPFFAAMLAGGLAAGIAAFLAGIPTLRLKGAYFAIATWALAKAVQQLALVLDITGGPDGIRLPSFLNPQFFYYVMLAVVANTFTAYWYILEKAPFGLKVKAIREDESGAMCLGINSIKIKMQVFLLSTFPAGLIGGVYAYWITHIDPASVLGDLITDQAAVMAVFGTDSSGKCRNCSPLQTSPKSRGRETRLDDTRADRSCRPCRTTGRQPHAGQPQKAGGEQGAGAQSDAPASRRGCRRPQPYRSRPDH